jgi:hypothetical protein
MERLAREAYAQITDRQAVRNAEFTVGSMPECQADPLLIRQVLANLIENALKYSSRRETPRVEVGAIIRGEKKVYFVRDNGIGFDMKYVDKLFGVFHRLHSNQEFEGTGIGLAIVLNIIQRHGGKVWAEAEPDNGATFYLTL